MTPFIINLTSYEEAQEEQVIKKRQNENLLQRNRQVIMVYAAFFSGMILTLSIVFLLLPSTVVEKLFSDQVDAIKLIRGSATFFGSFETIFINNAGVLFIAFLLSFIFGAGAVFILTWNATILSTAIGLTAKSIGGVVALPFAIFFYFPHGSLEILAYFIGSMAGGIVSAAITRRHMKELKTVLKDSFVLLGIAVFILFIAALIESVSLVQFAK